MSEDITLYIVIEVRTPLVLTSWKMLNTIHKKEKYIGFLYITKIIIKIKINKNYTLLYVFYIPNIVYLIFVNWTL